MKNLICACAAAGALALTAFSAEAASVTIGAGSSSAFISGLDLDPGLPGDEGALVGITGAVDSASFAPAGLPAASMLDIAFSLDLSTLEIISGTYMIGDGVTNYLSGSITSGGVDISDPTAPFAFGIAGAHVSDVFDVSTILADFSVAVVLPATVIGPFGSLDDAVAAAPFAVSTSILFETAPSAVPLPAGGLLLLTAFGAFAVRSRKKTSA